MALRMAAWAFPLGSFVLLVSCATPSLDSAREEYYRGQFDQAEQELADDRMSDKDRVLYLMERGMIRQAAGDYERSAADFIEASDNLEQLETYSLSKGGASLVVNDNVQDYRGAPFERTLLHAFAAADHLAMGHWDDAGVEARDRKSVV